MCENHSKFAVCISEAKTSWTLKTLCVVIICHSTQFSPPGVSVNGGMGTPAQSSHKPRILFYPVVICLRSNMDFFTCVCSSVDMCVSVYMYILPPSCTHPTSHSHIPAPIMHTPHLTHLSHLSTHLSRPCCCRMPRTEGSSDRTASLFPSSNP